jgi:hypothetical protein
MPRKSLTKAVPPSSTNREGYAVRKPLHLFGRVIFRLYGNRNAAAALAVRFGSGDLPQFAHPKTDAGSKSPSWATLEPETNSCASPAVPQLAGSAI